MAEFTVWIVDDDDSIRWVLERALEKSGFEVASFAQVSDVRVALRDARPHAMLADIRMPGESGLSLLDFVREQYSDLPIIIMTAHSDLDAAVSAYEGGAFEYLPKPFDIDEVASATLRACQWHKDQSQLAADAQPSGPSNTELIGEAPAMQDLFRAIGRLARSNMSVLVTGESGSGKELIARALHRHSPRSGQPFIALNVAAIPADLVESELFGHERGAFTGAHTQRRGRFEQADGGTLFLDEIGDMPIDLQTRLLRVLADGQFYRVGGHSPIAVDVRVITATHRDLSGLVEQNLFREDLYHRLNVIRLRVPALRERREDIPALTHHLLAKAAEELATPTKQPTPELLEFLSTQQWQGNVRQLENLCRWLTVMAAGETLSCADLPAEMIDNPESGDDADWQNMLRRWLQNQLAKNGSDLSGATIPIVERTLIEIALAKTRNNRQEAAKLIGWGRNTLARKIKELGM